MIRFICCIALDLIYTDVPCCKKFGYVSSCLTSSDGEDQPMSCWICFSLFRSPIRIILLHWTERNSEVTVLYYYYYIFFSNVNLINFILSFWQQDFKAFFLINLQNWEWNEEDASRSKAKNERSFIVALFTATHHQETASDLYVL